MSDRPTPETAPLMHAAANESIEAVFRRGCDLERQRDEAREILAATLSALPVGYIPNHTPESIPERVADLVARYAEAERQRDAYAETLMEFLGLATDFAESRRGYLRFLALADEIDERHPELADNASVEARQ